VIALLSVFACELFFVKAEKENKISYVKVESQSTTLNSCTSNFDNVTWISETSENSY